ncbi:MAG: hypothetical protein Q8Q40_02670 [Methylococcaceae bacterium]|nr:hypothetical protein [Methylococcaceae bacterium]MDP3902863.1 hypothetical protein [Methylococcaceae bacterium]
MNILEIETHPICMVPHWLHSLGDQCLVSLSRYKYAPQHIEDQRELITIKLGELTPSWLESQLSSLPEEYELALHSVLMSHEDEAHIPMVDFATKDIQQKEIFYWAYEQLGITLKLFDSGRALHGYGMEPVSRDKWIRFMGLLLLANIPNHQPLTDTRWIGHRLLAGYSALRWSKNSSFSLKMPTLVTCIDSSCPTLAG